MTIVEGTNPVYRNYNMSYRDRVGNISMCFSKKGKYDYEASTSEGRPTLEEEFEEEEEDKKRSIKMFQELSTKQLYKMAKKATAEELSKILKNLELRKDSARRILPYKAMDEEASSGVTGDDTSEGPATSSIGPTYVTNVMHHTTKVTSPKIKLPEGNLPTGKKDERSSAPFVPTFNNWVSQLPILGYTFI